MIKQVKQLKYSELLHIVFVSKLLKRIFETFSLGKLFYEDKMHWIQLNCSPKVKYNLITII